MVSYQKYSPNGKKLVMSGGENFEIDEDALGYSDEKLEALSRTLTRFESGFIHWVAWESENSSFGKTFRKWANYPKFLPLFFSSDHGVHWGARCWPNEISSPYSTFFTWNKKKNDLMQKKHGKKSYHVPHPWVFYRKKYFPILPDNRSGTLVFYAHSNTKTSPIYENLEKYISDLKSLPEKYQPIALCLSFHDINKGLHKELRKYGLPLVTAGSTNSQKFVDRFYSLIYGFKYSSSSNIGSHSFYIIEAGIPFFLYGPYPEYQMKGSEVVKDGRQNINDYGDEEDIAEFYKFRELISVHTDEVTREQYLMVSKYLGLNSEVTRCKAALIFWRELFLHSGELIAIYAPLGKKLVTKIFSILISRVKV